ncbi:ABC transporter ATP-binding/permease protein YojI [Paraburkholderia nemoris]|uniref:cyclic peptide export ABC transporter n=1 Tax=Paraburkholderia nemoris TaxID=2793076 RepID=UPI00190E0EDB|nr:MULTISPECIES: cyclic peptide export ABC transporter [Paraburkholderia]MBK3783878.1 cyclic peptide export ABC transporter [Paraburkholderia aspalathi]CAE6801674.1 ABC transporter ATP-binding/permease protein YojI [Paraburkholderia nemoris]
MHTLWFLVKGSRQRLLLAIGMSLVSGFGNAAMVALINQALSASREQLVELGLRFLMIGVVVLITRTASQTLFMSLGQNAKASLRMKTINRIAAAPFAFVERQGSARSLGVLTQDLDAIVVLFVGLPGLVMNGAVIAGCLVYLGLLSWQVLVFAAVTVLIGSAGFHVANTRGMFHLRSSRRREDALVRHFRALFDGAKELKLHRARMREFIDETLATNVEAVRVQRTRGYVLYAAAASWGSFIFFAFIGCVLFVLTRHLPVTPHVMSGYAMIFLYMIMPIEGLLSAIPNLSTARVALERVEQVNAELPIERTIAAPQATAFESIVLEGVTHRYFREKENDVFTLGPVNLSFRPGELVYLIGGNGSGKTTLAKMLVGLYTPESGRILLNGKEVDEAQRDAYRQHFSVVFSDFFLFDTLLGIRLDNVDAAAHALLEDLQLAHKVKIENGVFSTLELSQGQRKRLALLVSYLEDRPFYLFDEWAADQDPLFKDVFYRRLLPELKAKGKTVVVITHDDRYFHLADRYIKLDFGQVVEEGAGGAQPADPFHAQATTSLPTRAPARA